MSGAASGRRATPRSRARQNERVEQGREADGGAVYAVLNPTARRYHRARAALVRACREAGLGDPHVLTTTRTDAGAAQARRARRAGARIVVVGGGDGTVREVAGELARSGVELGILPLGTANLFAHNAGLRTRDLRVAARRAVGCPARRFDVGYASWRPLTAGGVGPPSPERVFLVMAGIGHDAGTVLGTRPEFKRRLGWLSYLASGLGRLLAKPLAMRVSIDNAPARGVRTWSVIAANAGSIPGGIRVFPEAAPDDGVLDTLEVPLVSPLQWFVVAAKGLLHLSADVPALRYGRARRLWVVPEHPTHLHLDGDVVGRVADLRVRVGPGALLVKAP